MPRTVGSPQENSSYTWNRAPSSPATPPQLAWLSEERLEGEPDQALQIPLSAIPIRTVGPPPSASLSGTVKRTVQLLEDSGDEDAQDMAYLFLDDESDKPTGPPNKKNGIARL